MEMTAAFESKVPHKTPWLSIEYDVGDEPTELLTELAQLGWKEDERMNRLPPIGGRQELWIMSPKGTDLFGEWSESEARLNMPPVRRLLRQHGFDRLPWHRLTLAELL